MKYLYMIFMDEKKLDALSKEEYQALADESLDYDEALRKGGHLLANQARQAGLRRAVSAAYYSLFHLLTSEAAENWKHESQRHRFARMFDHGRMKTCSSRVSSRRSSA